MVKRIDAVRKYIGYNTDPKPMENVPEGSEFLQFGSVSKQLEMVYIFFDGDWREI